MIGIARLIGAAFAGGLDLYLSVAFLGIGSRLGWLELPVGIRGLENGLLLGSALVLLAIDVVTDKLRHIDSFWHAAHTIVRPGGTGLLAALALDGWPFSVRLGAAILAALVAFGAHAARSGLRVIINLSDRRWNSVVSLAENALTLAILAAVMVVPASAPYVAGGLLLALVVAGPRLWRAARFGLGAAHARFRGFFGDPGWRSPDQLPKRLRTLAHIDPHGIRPARVAHAAVHGLRGAGTYRSGWLVLDADGPAFLCEAGMRPRRVPIPSLSSASVVPGLLTDTLRCETGDGAFTLFIYRDGPPADIVAGEIGPIGS